MEYHDLMDKETARDKVKELNKERYVLEERRQELQLELAMRKASKDEREYITQAFLDMVSDEIDKLGKEIRRFKWYAADKKAKSSFNLDEVKQVPIEHLIGSPQRKSSDRHYYCCPLHNEKTPSFVVYAKSNRFYCFGCHQGGSVIDLYMKLHGVEFKEACQALSCG